MTLWIVSLSTYLGTIPKYEKSLLCDWPCLAEWKDASSPDVTHFWVKEKSHGENSQVELLGKQKVRISDMLQPHVIGSH